MMIPSPAASAALLTALALPVASQSTGRPGHGLIGFPITMYQPACAHACRASLPRSLIPCGPHGNSTVSAACLANSDAFLLSAAWCINARCFAEDVPVSRLELFWEEDLVGRDLGQPMPKFTYSESLAKASRDSPSRVLGKGEVFDRVVLVDEREYRANWNAQSGFEKAEVNHQKFALIVLATGVGIPVALSLLRFLPFPPSLTSKFYAYLIDPPAFSRYHAAPVLGLGMIPTRGQALFILYLLILNIVLAVIGHQPLRPNSWFSKSASSEIFVYAANRLGMLSFANLPLLFLYAGRNNLLLWLTNWSHSTFLLLHRWVALLCVLEAAAHSSMFLHSHIADHATKSQIPYWRWGVLGTLSLVLLIPTSLLPVRRRAYELFHAAHILLAVLVVVGCWHHVVRRYGRQWGYENWIVTAAVVWAFDWVLRAARSLRRGVKRAFVTRVDEDYIRVDVPGVDCAGHAYAYFPTLTWRFWESHPLSVAGVAYHAAAAADAASPPSSAAPSEKAGPSSSSPAGTTLSGSGPRATGVRFFVRVGKGTTHLLANRAGSERGIPVLLEAYSGESRLYEDGARGTATAGFPNVVFLAGGAGITAILPKLSLSQTLYKPMGGKKLYWGVRAGASGLVEAVRSMVPVPPTGVAEGDVGVPAEGRSQMQWGDVEVHVAVGERFDLRAVLEAEVANKDGTTVVVCGPAAMADEGRMVVTALGRHGAKVRLVEETFVW